MKKPLVITCLTLAVILLGIFGGIAAAQGHDQDKISRGSSMIPSKMAEILGIEEDRVEQAFKQAISETKDERIRNYLARLVETGKINQGQADRKLEWMKENPGFRKNYPSFSNPHDKYGHFKRHKNRTNW